MASLKHVCWIILAVFCLLTPAQAGLTSCIACKAVVKSLQAVYDTDTASRKIVDLAATICGKFTSNPPAICHGITAQFKAEFLYVVRQVLFDPDQFCGLFFSNCGSPHNPFSSHWNVTIPPQDPSLPPAAPVPLPTSQSAKKDPTGDHSTFRVLQLSDFHFDETYTPGSEAQCDAPLCCQPSNDTGSLVPVKQPAGYWGSIASCDVPLWTIENMLQHINKTEKIDYIILSGDYMSHKDWAYTRKGHVATLNRLSDLMNTYFPTTPTIWGIGNHEGVPVNAFAPHFVPRKFRPQWMYNALYNSGQKWMSTQNRDEVLYRGSFSTKLTQSLKLVSINTGYCEKTNFFLYINQTDPDGTLQWLVDELVESEKSGEFVHIIAHIPPGNGECLEGWARNYYRIVQRFSDTIRAQFFGHIHWDSFSVFYEDMDNAKSSPIGVLYAAPSVTSFENLNPAYRIYTVDAANRHEVLDFETYFLNLTLAQKKENVPKWELLYTAKAEYGLSDLSPASWQSLSESLLTNITVFDRFVRNYARRHDYPCDSDCRFDILCGIRSGHHNDRDLCSDLHSHKDPLGKLIRKRAGGGSSLLSTSFLGRLWDRFG